MARADADSQIRFAAQAVLLEVVFLFAASCCGIGYRVDLLEDSFRPFALIALTALAMGTRNVAVRKLATPDLTTHYGPDINDHGHCRGLFTRERPEPEIGQKSCVGRRNVFAAALGAVVIHYSISAALWLATAISALYSAALVRSVRTSDCGATAAL